MKINALNNISININQIIDELTANQKIICLIALASLALLTSIVIYKKFFKAKVINPPPPEKLEEKKIENEPLENTPEPISEIEEEPFTEQEEKKEIKPRPILPEEIEEIFKIQQKVHDANFIYSGETLNGLYHGKGQLRKKSDPDFLLDGDFKNGIFVKGKVVFDDKEFEGSFSESDFEILKLGGMPPKYKGELIYEKIKYFGTFIFGKLNGKGKKIYPDGKEEEGLFENDELKKN